MSLLKNAEEILLEKKKRLKQLDKLFPKHQVTTDPFGIPANQEDKTLYLKLFELTNYIGALNWVIGYKDEDVKKEFDNVQKNPAVINELLPKNPTKTKKEVEKYIQEIIKQHKKNLKNLIEEYDKIKGTPDMADADPFVLEYEERKLRSNLFGCGKGLFWFLGCNPQGLEKEIELPIIDNYDISQSFDS